MGKVQCMLYPPESKPSRTDPTIKPTTDLKLAYVPTYNGKTGRNNIYFVDRDNIAFYVIH